MTSAGLIQSAGAGKPVDQYDAVLQTRQDWISKWLNSQRLCITLIWQEQELLGYPANQGWAYKQRINFEKLYKIAPGMNKNEIL